LTTEYRFSFGFTPSLSGFRNMEIDRLMGEAKPPSSPVVRLFTWNCPTISFGRSQNPVKRLRIQKCLKDGIDIVARPTGGREILHGWDLCCSVIRPKGENRSSVQFSLLFDEVNEILRQSLVRFGIAEAEYHAISKRSGFKDGPCFSQIDRGEISVSGMKIIASAQRVYDGVVLQQSSITLRRPELDIMDYLKIRNGSGEGGDFVNSVACLEDVLDETFSIPRIVEVIKGAFESKMGKSRGLKLPEIL
jgi:lipoate-protein ligase A